MDIQHLQDYLQAFADERNWNQFHTPKNLSMALAAECGELLEVFQWLKPEETTREALGPHNKQAAQDEIADIFIYLLRLSSVLGIDMEKAFWEKMEKNGKKYPPNTEEVNPLNFNR